VAAFRPALVTGALPSLVPTFVKIVIFSESNACGQRDCGNQNNSSLEPACTHNGPPL
jgi:hypothetical protein